MNYWLAVLCWVIAAAIIWSVAYRLGKSIGHTEGHICEATTSFFRSIERDDSND